jgi:cobalamin biosynthetic protein CobC
VLEHGGRIAEVAAKYQIPVNQWLDLSTGINPVPWPVPPFDASLWQHLPYNDDALEIAADHYYGGQGALAVAGSQAAIQTLPHLRSRCRIGMLPLTYSEHAHAWRRAGHEIILLQAEDIEHQLDSLDVLLVVNPNNPTATCFSPQQLLAWHQQLQQRGGWLIVDEAFMDATPANSLVPQATLPGLIVLRSLGKFFGLAGVRCGFIFSDALTRKRLAEWIGPWTITGPSRYVATRALQDETWQQQTCRQLPLWSDRLGVVLAGYGLHARGTALFQWVMTTRAPRLQQQLAQRGIWVRRFATPASLRFGLPGSAEDWQRLEQALSEIFTHQEQPCLG